MLLNRLLELQRELAFSDGQMAAEIGIPRTTYNGLRNRRTRLSLEHARRIVTAFPELAPYVLEPEPAEAEDL